MPADGAAEVSLTSPFTMAARVSFAENRAADERATGPVFDLEGSGTVTLRLSSIVDDATGKRLYFFREAVYQFTPSR